MRVRARARVGVRLRLRGRVRVRARVRDYGLKVAAAECTMMAANPKLGLHRGSWSAP